MYLEVLLHHRRVAVLTAHCVVQAALVEVPLRDVQAAVVLRALDERVLAVQHDVVVHVDALLDPGAAGLRVRAADDQLVQHRLDDLGHGAQVLVGVDAAAARGAGAAALVLGAPGMVEAVAAEEVAAEELGGAVEGRVADEAHEVAVGRGDVLEEVQVGGLLCDGGAAVLRVQ
jgi:hypothetical protein